MWQKMLQVGSGGSGSNDVVCGTFTVDRGGTKVFNVPTNSFALIYLISATGYYAYWVLDGTKLILSSGTSTSAHVSYSSGRLICGNLSSVGALSYVVMIGDKDKFPSL